MSKAASLLLRAAALVAVAIPATVGPAAPAAATHPVRVTPFFAEHRTPCASAYTEGLLLWNPAHPGEVQRVDVSGVLVDEPGSACERPTVGTPFVELTAYVEGRVADIEVVPVRLPGSPTQYQVRLTNGTPSPTAPLDQVDVRVCRTFNPMLPAFSCGPVQTYRPTGIGPAE